MIAAEPVVATPVAAVPARAPVCDTGCDYLINDGSGCYMAKRKVSTPQRC